MQEMQAKMDSFSEAYSNFGLTISTKKTEVMFKPAPGKQSIEPQITVNGKMLQAVESFTYLPAPYLGLPPSMPRSTTESPRQVSHSEDCGRKYGRGEESALRPN